MSDLRPVVCEQAFRWECLDCGVENFDRAEAVRFEDPEVEADTREQLGVEPWEEGGVVQVPTTVTCRGCLAMFKPFDEEEEGE